MLRFLCSVISLSLIFSVDYYSDIQPIFDSNCGGCHLSNSQGGLNLSSYQDLMDGGDSGDVILPGNSSESILYQTNQLINHLNMETYK